MFITHKNISRQGVKANEDYAFSCEHFIFVADGATGLTNKKYTSYESDAQWFTQRLGVLLQERLYDMSKTIKDILLEIISELNYEYTDFLSGGDCDALAMPSAGLSILRLNGDTIELFQLGDCVAIVLTKDNNIMVLFDDSLQKLDKEVIKNTIDISHKSKISFSKALMYVKDQLIRNRKRFNKPDGYWILDLSGVGVYHAYISNFAVRDVKAAAVMSDGFAEIVDLFKLYDYRNLLKKMEDDSLDSLCDELFKAQDTDPFMDKYPRLKRHDDSSAAWCAIK